MTLAHTQSEWWRRSHGLTELNEWGSREVTLIKFSYQSVSSIKSLTKQQVISKASCLNKTHWTTPLALGSHIHATMNLQYMWKHDSQDNSHRWLFTFVLKGQHFKNKKQWQIHMFFKEIAHIKMTILSLFTHPGCPKPV